MNKKKIKKQGGSRLSADNDCPKDCLEDNEENLDGPLSVSSRNQNKVICGSDGNTYR